jgi:hypothetical protein
MFFYLGRNVMLRHGLLLLSLCGLSSVEGFGCTCVGNFRPCEKLRSDAVFVGRVVETTAVRHTMDQKDSWSPGFSMRFAVEESLRGGLGTEVIIETGSGGGDCGSPLDPGGRFLILAYKDTNGQFWTGICSGNRALVGGPEDNDILDPLRRLVKKGTGSILGVVTQTKPVWQDDDIRDASDPRPVRGMILYAKSDKFSASTRTADDGSYGFEALPNGKYKVVPEARSGMDFDHEYEDRYEAEVGDGACANISFRLEPNTRIRGHVTLPPGIEARSIEVVALPAHVGVVNQFKGKWDFTEDGRFDLWPLPPGDYLVGININSSPKEDAPFPPTYYPGVTRHEAAGVVHLEEGQVRELELIVPEVAKPRTVNFVAIGLDGKPLRKIYIQREDLRHPGDAASYVNVDLDPSGAGSLIVYAGYEYHLHASHWVSHGNDWCAKPVKISAGTRPVHVRFVMDHKDENCDLQEIDGLRK